MYSVKILVTRKLGIEIWVAVVLAGPMVVEYSTFFSDHGARIWALSKGYQL